MTSPPCIPACSPNGILLWPHLLHSIVRVSQGNLQTQYTSTQNRMEDPRYLHMLLLLPVAIRDVFTKLVDHHGLNEYADYLSSQPRQY